MTPKLLPDGSIQIPKRAEGDGIVGDAVEVISPGDPRYDALRKAIDSHGV